MTDNPHTLERYRLPLAHGRQKHARALMAPAGRSVPATPLLLAGALLLGLAGILAWRNRERITEAASPILQDAMARGQALVTDALIKGNDLMDEARASSMAIGARVARLRRDDAGRSAVSNVY
jgi:LPXTG-motif cell wall-anchored protein